MELMYSKKQDSNLNNRSTPLTDTRSLHSCMLIIPIWPRDFRYIKGMCGKITPPSQSKTFKPNNKKAESYACTKKPREFSKI